MSEGMERRKALHLGSRLSASRPWRRTRARRRSIAAFFDPGPRFPGRFCRPDQPAPGRETL